jgi:monoamine oxidase
VIVLGAGVSGMTAGYELGKLGYDYQILEARSRVGGVNWTVRRGASHTEMGTNGETQTCQFDEGVYLNGGPWRIPHWHTGVLDYCKELGVPLQIFINEAEASYFFYEGAESAARQQASALEESEGRHGRLHHRALAKACNKDALDMRLTAEDKERLVGFLVTEGHLTTRPTHKGMEARGPGDPYNFSALLQSGFGSRVRSVLGGTGQAPMFQPVGGMDQFPKGFSVSQRQDPVERRGEVDQAVAGQGDDHLQGHEDRAGKQTSATSSSRVFR